MLFANISPPIPTPPATINAPVFVDVADVLLTNSILPNLNPPYIVPVKLYPFAVSAPVAYHSNI